MSVEPDVTVQGFAALEEYASKEVREQLASVWSIHMKAAQRGVTSALSCGPLLSFPVFFFNYPKIPIYSRLTPTNSY